MDTTFPAHQYEQYDNLVDYELSSIMTRASFSNQTFIPSPPRTSPPHSHQSSPHPGVHPLLKPQLQYDASFEPTSHGELPPYPPNPQVQLSDFDLAPAWQMPYSYPQYINHGDIPTMPPSGLPTLPYNPHVAQLPHQTYHYFNESESQSPWSSSPEYTHCRPLSTMEEDEDAMDDKPYARLIYEALMQAPGHRMMLREIYDWFRLNTNKPQESGTNGWQNSIRHNLSMNKVGSCHTHLTARFTDLASRLSRMTVMLGGVALGRLPVSGF
jgi:hypothetical protein